jgi:hypothetical protein
VDGVILALAILIGLGFYFLPTIIAQIRSTKRAATIFAVNLIFGWTVVGWIAAVIWALGQQPSPEGEPASGSLLRLRQKGSQVIVIEGVRYFVLCYLLFSTLGLRVRWLEPALSESR